MSSVAPSFEAGPGFSAGPSFEVGPGYTVGGVPAADSVVGGSTEGIGHYIEFSYLSGKRQPVGDYSGGCTIPADLSAGRKLTGPNSRQ